MSLDFLIIRKIIILKSNCSTNEANSKKAFGNIAIVLRSLPACKTKRTFMNKFLQQLMKFKHFGLERSFKILIIDFRVARIDVQL